MDDQITHVVVEAGCRPLDKFQKTLKEIKTDLDKLLYTMKLTDTATSEAKLPDFMKEGWLEETLKELDRSNLTPEQRAELEMIIAGNMTEKVAMEEKVKEREDRVRAETKKQAIKNLLSLGLLSTDQIAKVQEVSEQFVLSIQEEINGK